MNIKLITLAFLLCSLNVFSQSGKIDDYMEDLAQRSRVNKGTIQSGIFSRPFTEITDGDEFPASVVEEAYNYLASNVQFVRIYRVNDRKINDGRAVGYVSVFASVDSLDRGKTGVNFYYVFSNYRGRVILHLEDQQRI